MERNDDWEMIDELARLLKVRNLIRTTWTTLDQHRFSDIGEIIKVKELKCKLYLLFYEITIDISLL